MRRTAALTPGACALASKHLGMAYFATRDWLRAHPELADEFTGAAHLGLCRAARDWDPRRGAITTFIQVCVDSDCRAVLRAARRVRRAPRGGRERDCDLGLLPGPPGPGPDDGELVGPLLASLPPRAASWVRALVIEGRTLREVAREGRCCPKRVRKVVLRSLAELRSHPLAEALAA